MQIIHRLQITLLKWQSLNLICKWYSITQTYFWFCPSFSFYYLQLALLMDVMARFHLLPMQAFELLLLFVSGVSMTASTTSKINFNVSTHGKFIYIGWNMYFSLYLNRAWASSMSLAARWKRLYNRRLSTACIQVDFWEFLRLHWTIFQKTDKRGLSFESRCISR